MIIRLLMCLIALLFGEVQAGFYSDYYLGVGCGYNRVYELNKGAYLQPNKKITEIDYWVDNYVDLNRELGVSVGMQLEYEKLMGEITLLGMLGREINLAKFKDDVSEPGGNYSSGYAVTGLQFSLRKGAMRLISGVGARHGLINSIPMLILGIEYFANPNYVLSTTFRPYGRVLTENGRGDMNTGVFGMDYSLGIKAIH